MKTYLLTHSGLVLDSAAARTDEFNFLAESTGDEWTSDSRESFARRMVGEIDDEEDPVNCFDVSWDNRDNAATESTQVARFAAAAEAEAFAKAENARLLREYIQGDNHLTLSLPDGWEMDYGQPRQGKYPLSRNVLCTLTAQGITVERTAHWSASGVTDDWLNFTEVHETLIDLMDHLLTEALEQSNAETEPA